MNNMLLIAGVFFTGLGAVWIYINHTQKPLIEREYEAYRRKIDTGDEDAKRSYRSIQADDALSAKRSNARNWYISRLLFGIGILLLLWEFYILSR